MLFSHANVLFSDTVGKIRLELMSLPNHSKGFLLPWTTGWDSDNCRRDVTISCLLPRYYPDKNQPYPVKNQPNANLQHFFFVLRNTDMASLAQRHT